MKFLLCLILLASLFLTIPKSVSADTTPSPTPTATPTPSVAQLTQTQSATMIVSGLQTFIASIDSWLGGFIFYTPDLFGNNIVLQDGTNLGAITNFRNVFYLISIPMIAIVIAFSALHIMNSDNTAIVKPFFIRLLFVGVLLVITPQLLSQTIQINNALVQEILKVNTTPQPAQFTGFVSDYLTNVNTQIAAGASPDQFGLPVFNFSVFQNIYGIIGIIFSHLLLFLITVLFLLFGILFIVFQFIMRFLSLLFLSVLFPLAIPFALSSKTENITKSYFQAWFSFLIHQPAFVLAYMLVVTILKAALVKNGASIGMMLFYIGALVFLGGVNVIATQIFGQPWTVLATEAGAFIAAKSITDNVKEVKRGLVGGSINGIRSLAGNKTSQTIGGLVQYYKDKKKAKKGSTSNTPPDKDSRGNDSQDKTSYGKTHTQDEKVIVTPPPAQRASFTQELQNKGMQTRIVDQKQGIVSIEGDGFKHKDHTTGLTSIYSTKADGIADGIAERDLQPTRINRQNFIDLSTFEGKATNPHNAFVTTQAKKQGLQSNYAHVTLSSDPNRVKNFLTLSREQNEKRGVKGVIVKRFGNNGGARTAKRVVRMYTTEDDV